MDFMILAAIVAFAFAVETTAGFGATVLSVGLGAHLYPLKELLPTIVPLNLLLSTYIVARHWRHVDRALLGRRILPFVGVGMALGILLFRVATGPALKMGLGAFIVAMSAWQLAKMFRNDSRSQRPLSKAAQRAVLGAAGVFHGMYFSGGPLVVLWASRGIPDKSVFRATLGALWALTGLVLVAVYSAEGLLTRECLVRSLGLLPAVGVGIAAGEFAHRRIDERRFRLLTLALLALTGAALLLRP